MLNRLILTCSTSNAPSEQITSKSKIDSNAVTPQSLRARATPPEIGFSLDRRQRSIVQIVAAHRSPSSPSKIARWSSRRHLVTESTSAFRPPCSAAPVLPTSRYFIFFSDSLSVSHTLSLLLSLLNEMKIIKWISSLSLSLSLSLYSLIRLTLSFSLLKFELCLSLAEPNFTFINFFVCFWLLSFWMCCFSCVVCLSVYL